MSDRRKLPPNRGVTTAGDTPYQPRDRGPARTVDDATSNPAILSRAQSSRNPEVPRTIPAAYDEEIESDDRGFRKPLFPRPQETSTSSSQHYQIRQPSQDVRSRGDASRGDLLAEFPGGSSATHSTSYHSSHLASRYEHEQPDRNPAVPVDQVYYSRYRARDATTTSYQRHEHYQAHDSISSSGRDDVSPNEEDLCYRPIPIRDHPRAQPVEGSFERSSTQWIHPERTTSHYAPAQTVTSAAQKTYVSNPRPSHSVETTSWTPTVAARTGPTMYAARSNSDSADTVFNSCLTSDMQEFASIPLDSWARLEKSIARNPSILDSDSQLFVKDATRAFALGKTAYANQCVHRAVLIHYLREYSHSIRLKKIRNMRDQRSEARDISEAFDRVQQVARSNAKKVSVQQSLSQNTTKSLETSSHQPSADRRSIESIPFPGSNASYQQSTPRQSQSYQAEPTNTSRNVLRGPYSHAQQTEQRAGPHAQTQGSSFTTSYSRDPHERSSAPSETFEHTGGIPEPQLATTSRVSTHMEARHARPPAGVLITAGHDSTLQRTALNDTSYQNRSTGSQGPRSEVSDETGTGHINRRLSAASTKGLPVNAENTFFLTDKTARLDPSYQIRHHSFYKRGTVFAVLWHEPASSMPANDPPNAYTSSQNMPNYTPGKFGEPIYTTIRRMVVVREAHGFCVCIQINTYRGKGLKKFKSMPKQVDAHSIIHMTDTQANYLPGEPETIRQAIAVKKASPQEKLDPVSRLCYSQPHTVQHNVKSKHVGQVTGTCLPLLLNYYKIAQNE